VNKKGQIFVNKRSSKKEFDPGQYSIVLGGHVGTGDSYDEAVKREAKEEAGITSRSYYLSNFKNFCREKDKEITAVYFFIADKELVLDKEEIEFGEFIDINKISGFVENHKFLPETHSLYKILVRNKEKILEEIND
jgi:isopentenyldiphosphate isomerase